MNLKPTTNSSTIETAMKPNRSRSTGEPTRLLLDRSPGKPLGRPTLQPTTQPSFQSTLQPTDFAKHRSYKAPESSPTFVSSKGLGPGSIAGTIISVLVTVRGNL